MHIHSRARTRAPHTNTHWCHTYTLKLVLKRPTDNCPLFLLLGRVSIYGVRLFIKMNIIILYLLIHTHTRVYGIN